MDKRMLFAIAITISLVGRSAGQLDPNELLLSPAQQIDNNQVINGQGQTQQQQGPIVDDSSTTTTTPSPTFTACVNACRTVQNYNPVCGSDGVTYSNQFRLQCARRCGLQVAMIRGGACQSL